LLFSVLYLVTVHSFQRTVYCFVSYPRTVGGS